VTQSYEVGRCYASDCEPAEMDEHDEAEPWDSVHGGAVPAVPDVNRPLWPPGHFGPPGRIY